MTEETFRRMDLFIKASGPLLVLVGIVVGVHQYKTNLEEDRKTQVVRHENIITQAKIDARKPFFEMQLSVYLEVTNVTARIARSLNKKAIDRFWELYKGPMILVENKAVEKAMVEFGNFLKMKGITEEELKRQLGLRAIEIAKECRKSLKTSWDVVLEPL
jgi:hypothetical protein